MITRPALLHCLCALSMLTLVRPFRTPHHIFHASRFTHNRGNQRLAAKIDEAVADANSISYNNNRTVTIIQRGSNHIVALKPPAVVCHHSGWSGSRAKMKRGEEPEIPMLQRVRDAIHDIDTRDMATEDEHPIRKVNLIHRLDRGASGALLLAYAEDGDSDDDSDSQASKKGDTAQLIEAMKSPDSIKTYVALVRGEGILHGEDFKKKGWFEVSRPIKDEGGEVKDATTLFNFVAGQAEDGIDQPRISLVLARPKDGRWHQIRKHLNGISHPILGDSTHGVSKINREWKEQRNLPGERIALHLGRLQLVPTENFPEGIDVSAPLLDDMLNMLRVYAPNVLEEALPVLEKEGILVEAKEKYEVGQYTIPEELLQPNVFDNRDVEILEESKHYVVVSKPPAVVAHHSSWTGKHSDPNRRWKENTPMLQRVRDKTGRRVNLIHRLDRGASGCLILSFAENQENEEGEKISCSVTRSLIESMRNPDATKTYIALCDGDGTWNGVNYLGRGWFTFDSPVRDEWGKSKEDAKTDICFIASAILPPRDDDSADHPMEGRKISIVLARPHTGRWHQIRQHLASGTIGHAILGDSSHGGRTRTNRI
ncbi:hypothetical protein ACHAXR_008268 [Thalassiosira sp. AJA248-18]